jgi:glyoxylase-like metal-dependent hydrolase (beta-lactamase superfamily II)
MSDRDTVSFSEMTLRAVHASGHSRGSTSLLGKKQSFIRGSLSAGSVGRGDFRKLRIRRDIFSKLANLPDDLLLTPD